MRGRRVIERRARVFLGCEGESEQGYGALLQRLVDASGARIHLVLANLQPACEPLELAKKAACKLAEDIRDKAGATEATALDVYGNLPYKPGKEYSHAIRTPSSSLGSTPRARGA